MGQIVQQQSTKVERSFVIQSFVVQFPLLLFPYILLHLVSKKEISSFKSMYSRIPNFKLELQKYAINERQKRQLPIFFKNCKIQINFDLQKKRQLSFMLFFGFCMLDPFREMRKSTLNHHVRKQGLFVQQHNPSRILVKEERKDNIMRCTF